MVVMNANVFANTSFVAMRALVRGLIDKVEFRHHGIGVLQGYVVENADPEIRIHIWSPKLLKPGIDESGDIHDHRFDMISHVMLGKICHEQLHERRDPDGEYEMLALTHARAAADTGYHGPTTPIPGRYAATRSFLVIDEACSYTFQSGKFHRSPLLKGVDLSVTVVEKHRQRDDVQARLLYPVNKPPVMAFGHRVDKDLIRAIVQEAKEKLT